MQLFPPDWNHTAQMETLVEQRHCLSLRPRVSVFLNHKVLD